MIAPSEFLTKLNKAADVGAFGQEAWSELNADLGAGLSSSAWFDALAPDQKDACVAAMLDALADLSDAGHDKWLKILAACARSGAPAARELCRSWSMRSSRYDPATFDAKFNSFRGAGPALVGVGTLIQAAEARGFDSSLYREPNVTSSASCGALPGVDVAVEQPLDLSRFQAVSRWNDIPVREWLLGTIALRSFYSLLASPGARGKTALAIMLAVSAALGRSDLCGMKVRSPLRVAFISGEDSGQEMMRRVRAFCQEHGVSIADLGDRLLVIGAREVEGLVFNRVDHTSRQTVVDERGVGLLERVGREHQADLILCDPLISFCPGGLNDNSSASVLMSRISQVCERLGCGMVLLHHVSKGAVRGGEETSAMASLGAVSISSHARVALAVLPLPEKEAPAHGIDPSLARQYVQLVNTKANLAPAGDSSLYFLKGVVLPNADPARGYPHGDSVQVAVPAQVGGAASLYTLAVLQKVLERLGQGAANGMPFSPSKNSPDRDYRPALADVLKAVFPEQTHTQREFTAEGAVKELIKRGWAKHQGVARPRKPGGSKGGASTAIGIVPQWDLTPWPGGAVGPGADHPGNGARVCEGPSDD